MVVNNTPLDPMFNKILPSVSGAEEISRDEVLKLNQMQIIIIVPAYPIRKKIILTKGSQPIIQGKMPFFVRVNIAEKLLHQLICQIEPAQHMVDLEPLFELLVIDIHTFIRDNIKAVCLIAEIPVQEVTNLLPGFELPVKGAFLSRSAAGDG